jgi:hypothetical protein
MKNKLLLFVVVLISAQSFAQNPDPELFKTWYITEVVDDFGAWMVTDFTPRINPTLTLTETYSFSGEAACNTYSGTLSYDNSNNYFEILSFERTNDDCNIKSHNLFEGIFFEFFIVGHSFSPWVEDEGNGEQTFWTISPWYPLLNGKNMPLGVNEYAASNVIIYPNPVSNTLFVTSETPQIERLTIFSVSGQVVFFEENDTNSVDVSGLSEGVYFLEITSEKEKSIQKFIKK